MRMLVYGGGFNPPHLGHLAALRAPGRALQPDRFLVIPDGSRPISSCRREPRLRRSAWSCAAWPFGNSWVEVSDLELRRRAPAIWPIPWRCCGSSFPEELILLLGTDMLLSFDSWYRYENC